MYFSLFTVSWLSKIWSFKKIYLKNNFGAQNDSLAHGSYKKKSKKEFADEWTDC